MGYSQRKRTRIFLWRIRMSLLPFPQFSPSQPSLTPSTLTNPQKAWIRPLLFNPGTRWLYSTGIDWAGKVVET
jgi:hypothetical protein